MPKSNDLPTTPVNDPTGNPFPPQPGPVPATDLVNIPVPAGQTNLLDPKVIAEEVKRGQAQNAAEYPQAGTPIGSPGMVADGSGGKITVADWRRRRNEEEESLKRIRDVGVD